MDQRTLAPRTLDTLTAYEKKLMATQTANLLRYWPLSDAAGTVVTELVAGNGGEAYIGVTLGQTGIGDGSVCPLFDGLNDYVNILTAGLTAGYNHDEGTLFAWVQLEDAEWTDGTKRNIAIVSQASPGRSAVLQKSNASDVVEAAHYSEATCYCHTHDQTGVNDFFTVALTWSVTGDIVDYFINGVSKEHKHGQTAGNIVLDAAFIGSQTGAANYWKGKIAHVAIWTKALTAAELVTLSSAT